jgi:hypothetical protein
MFKVGLIGLGYLGKIHLKCLKEIGELELTGIFDIDTELSNSLADQYGTKAFASMEELIDACDIIDIVRQAKHILRSQRPVSGNASTFLLKSLLRLLSRKQKSYTSLLKRQA